MVEESIHTKEQPRCATRGQSVVTGLGDEKEGAKIGAAILLRTFLRPGYEQFYTQTFDLAVAHLRLPRTPDPLDDPDTLPPLTPLSQALIAVFKEALPLARSQNKGNPESLDATGIQLDNAHLRGADLKQAWMPQVSLRKVDLSHADLSEVKLREADLREADFFQAKLHGAKLSQASLDEADLIEANLWSANLSGAKLREADLSGAQLSKADLRGANLEDALTLRGTKLYGVKGLTKEQLTTCKAKGAIIDEDSTTSPSQSTVSPSPSSQSNDAQAPSATPAQVSAPTPDTDGSSATSSQQGPES